MRRARKNVVHVSGSLLSPVTFVRAESGGFQSVQVDEVEVAVIGRGFSVTVWADKPEAAPIVGLDGQKYRNLFDAQHAIRFCYEVLR